MIVTAPVWTAPERLISTTVTAAGDRYRAKGVTLTTAIRDDLPPLWADPDRFAQALGNTLDDALRHDRRSRRGRRDHR